MWPPGLFRKVHAPGRCAPSRKPGARLLQASQRDSTNTRSGDNPRGSRWEFEARGLWSEGESRGGASRCQNTTPAHSRNSTPDVGTPPDLGGGLAPPPSRARQLVCAPATGVRRRSGAAQPPLLSCCGVERPLSRSPRARKEGQVDSMCRLQQQASGRTPMDLQPQSSDEPVPLHEAPLGAFRLAAGDPFQEPRTVVWLGVLSLGFALVLDAHENLLLAEGTLRLLARLLLDHLRLLTPSTNLLLRADRIEGILARFLPHGQLLFLNDQFVQGLEKEFSAAWPR
ncbi:uncharacterized protein LOC132021759 isoform X2 [Mustela nigripes]|uniref:uncharacterized protein LOC132008114 isoform X2 n=1 Tax=Mustela nigripes TaxID=77151 RepID=UPI0028161E42|nr:uncharacterized protein LOC132008114 isoform X2 [Mustela nigripes]XP_059262591.1 uncharacterized protein LOC132021759 isoform X2 [Mustela nigripes]